MTTYASLLAAGLDVCERHGYRTERPNKGWLPDAIATAPVGDTGDSENEGTESTSAPTPLFGDVDDPIALEPLDASDVDPTIVISRLWNNSTNGRRSLFVVPGSDADVLAETVAGLLSAPACVANEDDDGCRTFYNGPDRIALAGGGYALHKSTDAEFRWFETRDESRDDRIDREGKRDNRAKRTESEASAETRRSGSDRTHLVLADGDETVAVFDNVDGLGCPPASAFRYSYRRDARDKCFHVTDASGREVGVFTDIRSLRAAAYEPIPMPFVPEHLFDASVRSLWGVLAVDGDGDTRLYTANGREDR
ncbi:hypothetical protein [Halogranum rubrum]|uniref:Uncharacterized protein n=1 Tax=Halogranum salarium B-1 TaxID=1210908 RepID=J2ZLK6_9EURY|nr:hypothetical protein [Halogranum salarium]EJN61640.1 hypothetical protein HSB1_00070 [Halogranum salarium B-1]